MSAEPGWSDWFTTVLGKLRARYADLTDKEREQITNRWGNLNNGCPVPFEAPTQLIVIWVRHCDADRHYQLVQIEHFSDRPDEEVAVYGPFAPDQYLEVTGPILEETRWVGHLHHDHAFTEALRDRLVTAYQYVGPSLEDQQGNFGNLNSQLYMEWYASDIAFASFREIRRTDPAELVEQLLDRALGRDSSAPPAVTTVARVPAFNAVGWYSYSPFWIEEQPMLTYAERLANQRPMVAPDRGWAIPYNGTNVLAWQNGFLALEGNPDQNMSALGVLVAALEFLGIPFDLVDSTYAVRLALVDDFAIGSMKEGSQQSSGYRIMPPPQPAEDRAGVLKLNALERAAHLAEHLLGDRELAEIVTLYDQAALLLERHRELTASFLFAWTVCERLIHRKISALPLEPQRQRRLVNSRSVDPLIEILEIAGRISPAEYRDLMRWKNLRNNWIHKGSDVPAADTPALLKYVQQTVLDEVGLAPSDLLQLEPLAR